MGRIEFMDPASTVVKDVQSQTYIRVKVFGVKDKGDRLCLPFLHSFH
jgi:hypothetical protein